MARGRKSSYTEETGLLICQGLLERKGLRELEVELGFNIDSMYKWLDQEPEFKERYARARSLQAHSYSESIDANIERMMAGEITPEQCRVANDAYKWQAGKRMPSVYGDKLNLEHSGSVNHTANPADFLSTGTLEAIERELSLSESNEPVLTAEVIDSE
jgi:hypothetical protein